MAAGGWSRTPSCVDLRKRGSGNDNPARYPKRDALLLSGMTTNDMRRMDEEQRETIRRLHDELARLEQQHEPGKIGRPPAGVEAASACAKSRPPAGDEAASARANPPAGVEAVRVSDRQPEALGISRAEATNKPPAGAEAA